jgi:copper transport protein
MTRPSPISGSVALPARTPRRVRALTLLLGVIAGLFLLLAIPGGKASAHAAVVSSNPAQGSIVQTAPNQVVITFSEHVQAVDSRIQVIDPNGKKIGNGTPKVVGNELRIPVRTDGPHGTYLVSFRVISADSHPVGGGFVYSVGAPSPGGAPKPVNGGATDKLVATAVSIEQFVGFGGLILVVGPTLVLGALWPRRLDRTGPTKLAFWGLGTVIVGSLLGIYLEAPYGNGGSLFSAGWSDVSDVLDSTYGKAELIRIAVALVAGFLLRPILAGRGGKWDRPIIAMLGVVALLTWPLSGHAGSSDVAALTVIADAIHLAAVAVWVGGLVMLAVYLLRKANSRELTAILPVWSNWATLAVTVLVLAGAAQALIQIGSFGALFHTTYGQLVLVKIGLLAVILGFANVARLIVQRHARMRAVTTASVGNRVSVAAGSGDASSHDVVEACDLDGGDDGGGDDGDGDDGGGDDGGGDAHDFDDGEPPREIEAPQIRRLRRSVVVELVLAAVVLAATSILVQTKPARSQAAENAITANSPASVTLNSPIYSLQVDFSPIATGTEIHMYAYNPQGAPLKVVQWTVTAALPSKGIEATTVDNLLPVTDSHAVAQATLPVKGDWTFSFTLRTSDIDEATVVTTVPIN